MFGRILLVVVVFYLGLNMNVRAQEDESTKRMERIAKYEKKYRYWGAFSLAIENNKKIVIVNSRFNGKNREAVQEGMLNDCREKRIPYCVVFTFPGCFYTVLGSVPTIGGSRTVWRGTHRANHPERVIAECRATGHECTPPIGGCNDLDEELLARVAKAYGNAEHKGWYDEYKLEYVIAGEKF